MTVHDNDNLQFIKGQVQRAYDWLIIDMGYNPDVFTGEAVFDKMKSYAKYYPSSWAMQWYVNTDEVNRSMFADKWTSFMASLRKVENAEKGGS